MDGILKVKLFNKICNFRFDLSTKFRLLNSIRDRASGLPVPVVLVVQVFLFSALVSRY
jgi:hypothetical protein